MPEEGAPPPPEDEPVPMKKVRHGVGIYKLDGNEYEGEFFKDKMHGHGLFKFEGGDIYDVRSPSSLLASRKQIPAQLAATCVGPGV